MTACDKKRELRGMGRWLTIGWCLLYTLAVGVMCFSKQPLSQWETPNIIYLGRLRFLLVPFNSLVSLGELSGLPAVVKVIGQNLMNVCLLYPLLLGLIFLSQRWRSYRSVVGLAFCLSLTIEVTQLLLDYLVDANRVFEIDDLLTNTLGGVLALWTYRLVQATLSRQKSGLSE